MDGLSYQIAGNFASLWLKLLSQPDFLQAFHEHFLIDILAS